MNAATCTCIIGSMPRLRAWTAANCRIVAVRLALAAQCNRWFDVSQTALGIVRPSWAMPVVSERRLGIPGTSPRVRLLLGGLWCGALGEDAYGLGAHVERNALLAVLVVLTRPQFASDGNGRALDHRARIGQRLSELAPH